MFVPGFLTLEALLGSQITVLSPEQVRVTKEVSPLVSAQTGAVSEKKGAGLPNWKLLGLWVFITYAAAQKVTWLLNLGTDAQDSQ